MKIPKNIKAVIFDMDGLLIDSETLWNKVDTVVMQKRGFTPTPELFLKRLGTGHKRTVEIYKEEAGIDEDTDKIIKERLDLFYGPLWEELQLMDGVRELVEALHKRQIILGIATGGHSEDKVIDILKRFNIYTYFSTVVSMKSVKKHKPHPDIFLLAAEKLEIHPSECLAVEDAPNGAKSAKSAGMLVYAVNKNKSVREKLDKAGADEVFTSLSEIEV